MDIIEQSFHANTQICKQYPKSKIKGSLISHHPTIHNMLVGNTKLLIGTTFQWNRETPKQKTSHPTQVAGGVPPSVSVVCKPLICHVYVWSGPIQFTNWWPKDTSPRGLKVEKKGSSSSWMDTCLFATSRVFPKTTVHVPPPPLKWPLIRNSKWPGGGEHGYKYRQGGGSYLPRATLLTVTWVGVQFKTGTHLPFNKPHQIFSDFCEHVSSKGLAALRSAQHLCWQ
jgi:hypothetical protein